MKMLIIQIFSTILLISYSQQSMAEVRNERSFTEYSVYFPEASKIKATFTLTDEVDTCNSFLLHGQIYDVPAMSQNYYTADFMLIGTMMWCDDRTLVEQSFTLEKEFATKALTILVPTNIQVAFFSVE